MFTWVSRRLQAVIVLPVVGIQLHTYSLPVMCASQAFGGKGSFDQPCIGRNEMMLLAATKVARREDVWGVFTKADGPTWQIVSPWYKFKLLPQAGWQENRDIKFFPSRCSLGHIYLLTVEMQPFPLRRAGGLTKRWWVKGSNCWAVKGVSCQDPPTGPEWGMRSDEVALSSPAPSMVTPRRHLSQSLLPWPFCGYLFLFCVFPPDKPQCSGLQWSMGQMGRRYRRGSCQLIPLDINEEKGEV